MRPLLRACLASGWLLMLLLGAFPAARAQQTSLSILDPRVGRTVGQGTVEQATIAVRPRGTYAEVSLDLTYSARGLTAAPTDTLEVLHYFSLPTDVTVTDSWLWIDSTTIVKAKLLDTWLASQIYENIVRRRRDPSILFKRSPSAYEFRIFPMKATERRRARLTFLLPANATPNGLSVTLPAALLAPSRAPVTPTIVTWADALWGTPRLLEVPSATFQPAQDPAYGAHLRTTAPATAAGLTLAFQRPAAALPAVRLQIHRKGSDAWYALSTPLTTGPMAPRRFVFAFNADPAALVSTTPDALLQSLRTALTQKLAPSDSFLLVASRRDGSPRITPRWLAADTASIRTAFAAIGPLAAATRLRDVLPEAVRAAAASGAGLFLLAASNTEDTADAANAILRMLPVPLPQTYVLDAAQVLRYQAIGARAYYGNEYLYQNLTVLSGGVFSRYYAASAATVASEVERAVLLFTPRLDVLDVQPVIPDGSSFSRVDLSTAPLLDRPFLQTGRFFGSDPIGVRVAGLRAGVPFAYTLPVQAERTDSTLRAFATGPELRRLEAGAQTNDVISRLIALSLAERVLTTRTAFLALEPSMGGETCASCGLSGGGGPPPPTASDPVPSAGVLSLRAFPNPARGPVSVEVAFGQAMDSRTLRAEVYDALGRRVRTLLVPEGQHTRLRLVWDGTSDGGPRVAPGTYLVVITTPTGRTARAVTVLG